MLLGVLCCCCWCPKQQQHKQVKTADVKMRFGDGQNMTHQRACMRVLVPEGTGGLCHAAVHKRWNFDRQSGETGEGLS